MADPIRFETKQGTIVIDNQGDVERLDTADTMSLEKDGQVTSDTGELNQAWHELGLKMPDRQQGRVLFKPLHAYMTSFKAAQEDARGSMIVGEWGGELGPMRVRISEAKGNAAAAHVKLDSESWHGLVNNAVGHAIGIESHDADVTGQPFEETAANMRHIAQDARELYALIDETGATSTAPLSTEDKARWEGEGATNLTAARSAAEAGDLKSAQEHLKLAEHAAGHVGYILDESEVATISHAAKVKHAEITEATKPTMQDLIGLAEEAAKKCDESNMLSYLSQAKKSVEADRGIWDPENVKAVFGHYYDAMIASAAKQETAGDMEMIIDHARQYSQSVPLGEAREAKITEIGRPLYQKDYDSALSAPDVMIRYPDLLQIRLDAYHHAAEKLGLPVEKKEVEHFLKDCYGCALDALQEDIREHVQYSDTGHPHRNSPNADMARAIIETAKREGVSISDKKLGSLEIEYGVEVQYD